MSGLFCCARGGLRAVFFGIGARTWMVLCVEWVCLGAGVDRAIGEVDVLILAGQSNAVGRTDGSFLTGQGPGAGGFPGGFPGVLWSRLWYDLPVEGDSGGAFVAMGPQEKGDGSTFFGPEITLGATAAMETMHELAIVKVAQGGTSLAGDPNKADWHPHTRGELFDLLIDTVGQATAALEDDGEEYRFAGLFWVQGERDSRSFDMASSYEANLTDWIAAVRDALDEPGLPVVISRIHDDLPSEAFLYADQVRDAQLAVAGADPLVQWIDADDLSLSSDQIHYDETGQLELGRRLAHRFVEAPEAAIVSPEPGGLALWGIGVVMMAGRRLGGRG